MNSSGHTFFLSSKSGSFALEMASRKDLLSSKIGRMAGRLKALEYPSAYINSVISLGSHAKPLQGKIFSKSSGVPEAKLRAKLSELGSKISELGVIYGYKDIDSEFGPVKGLRLISS